ncbi:MAG TPA: CPBP family intramembrane glutamic endopeptidase [Phycisphaerae bacterium]|nr:CPBP family intramembrane glutamic endopeptidase [Phycisphaerae bacterium]
MAKQKSQPRWLNFGSEETYFDHTHRPLQCLIFISPLLLIYQIGISIHPWTPRADHLPNVIAFELILQFFALFGAVGVYLPLMCVVAILLGWHISRRDPWRIEPGLYFGMAGESFLWAIPMLLMAALVARGAPLSEHSGGLHELSWQTRAVLSIGAGVYEELLFRLMLITFLNILLVDIFRLSLGKAIPLILIISAVLFSLYHYLGDEQFTWPTFIFRTVAGLYFAGLFIFRGFGIDVAAHSIYDLMVVALQTAAGG